MYHTMTAMRRLLSFVLVLGMVAIARADPSVPIAQDEMDADDAALLQMGIDLKSGNTLLTETGSQTHAELDLSIPPTPTYTSTIPAGHERSTVAKFPLLQEIEGVEKENWQQIEGLLKREPRAAAEENLDMKLDELEKKFKDVKVEKVPSAVPPEGSSLLTPAEKVATSLRKIVGKNEVRLKQLKKKLEDSKKKSEATKAAKAASAASKAASTAASKAKSAAQTPKEVAKAKKVQSKVAKSMKKASKAAQEAKKAIEAVGKQHVQKTVETIKGLEVALKKVGQLFGELKNEIGYEHHEEPASADAVVHKAIAENKKKEDEITQKIEAMKSKKALDKAAKAEGAARFLQLHTESESEQEHEHDAFAEAAAAALAETESGSEASVESESESEKELMLDAEAVDDILQAMM